MKVCSSGCFEGRRQVWLRATMPTPKVSLAPRPPDSRRERLWTLGEARRRFGRVDLAVLGAEDLRRQFEHDGWTGRSPAVCLARRRDAHARRRTRRGRPDPTE